MCLPRIIRNSRCGKIANPFTGLKLGNFWRSTGGILLLIFLSRFLNFKCGYKVKRLRKHNHECNSSLL